MAYSEEDIDLVKNRLLEIAKKSSQSWSDVDDQIFNAFWDDKKDNPNAVLDFPINQPQTQQKSGGSSPFAVENGVVTYRGKPTTELSEEERRGLFGSVGGDILNDPRFRRTVQVGQGDAGFVEEEQADPELVQRLYRDGQWYRQVGALRSVGGEGEVSDPSNIVWDEELGWITPMSNVREYDDTVFTPGMLLLAGGMLGAVGMAGGFSGLGIGGAAEGTAATTGGSTTGLGQYAGMTTGLDGAVAGTGAATGTGAGAGVGAGIGSGGLEVSEAMRNILAQGTAAGGSAASTAANAAIQQGVQTLGGIGGGSWFSNLSPMAQRAIMSAAGQGASAIMAGRRQESAQDFARQQQERQYEVRRQEEERAAEERRIRGTPSQYTFNVTRRPGIIGGGMGG